MSCHVIVRNRLSLSSCVAEPCLRARAGYSLDKSPAQHRALIDEQHGVQYLAQGHFNMQPGAGI